VIERESEGEMMKSKQKAKIGGRKKKDRNVRHAYEDALDDREDKRERERRK
jgi:hypothetical protein